MLHGRLEWFRPEDLDAQQRKLYDDILGGPRADTPHSVPMVDGEGRFHGPFNALLVEPRLGEAAQRLGAAVRYESVLDSRAREIAILEVAFHCQSNFEYFAHRAIGLAAGLTDDEVDALSRGSDCMSFSAAERLTREVTSSLVRFRDLGDGLYAQAVELLGVAVVADLVVLVGFYWYTAMTLQVFRVPLPEGAQPVFTSRGDRVDGQS